MKTVFLVRHAKSSWDQSMLDDFDRPLNERGNADAPRMGKLLKKKKIKPDILYSSPAVRALTTAKLISTELGYPENKIKTDRQLYHADEETLFNFLRTLSDDYDEVMLFGHNPGITEFANELLGENIVNIPTTGVVSGRLAIESWKDAKPGCGTLRFFDSPKMLNKD